MAPYSMGVVDKLVEVGLWYLFSSVVHRDSVLPWRHRETPLVCRDLSQSVGHSSIKVFRILLLCDTFSAFLKGPLRKLGVLKYILAGSRVRLVTTRRLD